MKNLAEWAANHYFRKMSHQPSLYQGKTPRWAASAAPLLLLLFLSHSTALAEESTAPEADRQAAEVTASFLDEYHDYMLDQIKGKTLWFDNFFGDRRIEEDDPPSSFVRLRAVGRFTEGYGLTFPVRLRASLELPKVNRRLRLVIFGGNRESDRFNESAESFDSSTKSGAEKDWTNLGLRYLIYKSLRDRFHFGGGLSLGWPLEYYGRVRYERLLHKGASNMIRFSETGFWNSLHGLGETTRLDLEKNMRCQLTGRVSLFGTYSDEKPGLQWGAETSLFRQLSEASALALDLGIYGLTEPSTRVESYRIAGRYRRNFLRPWLFFEVEPEVVFPRSPVGKLEAIGSLTTVLEIQFIT